jgi:hypothetical protein
MRNANRSVSRSSRGKNHPLRRFIARHLTLSLALLILGVIVLSSVHAGALDDGSKSATGRGQKHSTKDHERLEAELFVDPPAPLVVTRLTATSSDPDQHSNAQDQDKFIDGASVQVQTVPVLTRQNAPDIPQCREILNQQILDIVNAASEDPAETFERIRRAHPHMIMMPPPLDCASKLWVAARRSNRVAESVLSPELLSLRQNPIEEFFNLSALNASVGSKRRSRGRRRGVSGREQHLHRP